MLKSQIMQGKNTKIELQLCANSRDCDKVKKYNYICNQINY